MRNYVAIQAKKDSTAIFIFTTNHHISRYATAPSSAVWISVGGAIMRDIAGVTLR